MAEPIKNSNERTIVLITVATVVSSIFQVYLFSISGFSITAFFMLSFISLFAIQYKNLIRHKVVQIFLILTFFELLSFLWAQEVMDGIRDMYFNLLFGVVLALLLYVGLMSVQNFEKIGRWYVGLALIQSSLIIIFRLFPSIESYFYHSIIATPFISSKVLESLGAGLEGVNVSDPDKAGGFMLAANVAGVWALVCAFLSLAFFRGKLARLGYVVASIHLIAAVAAGSKATLVLCIFGGAIYAYLLIRNRLDAVNRLLAFIMTGSVIALGAFVLSRVSAQMGFFADSGKALQSRQVMWDYAKTRFHEVPLQGLGYGGWTREFWGIGERYAGLGIGVNGHLAPHNILIILWTNGGLLVVISALALALYVGYSLYKNAILDPINCAPFFCAFGVYFLQSFGENYVMYSDPHLAVPFAFMCVAATLYAGRPRRRKSPARPKSAHPEAI